MKVIKVESRATLNILKEMGEIIKQENTIGTFKLTSPMGEKCLTLMASDDSKLAEVSVTFDRTVKIVLFDENMVDEVKVYQSKNCIAGILEMIPNDISIIDIINDFEKTFGVNTFYHIRLTYNNLRINIQNTANGIAVEGISKNQLLEKDVKKIIQNKMLVEETQIYKKKPVLKLKYQVHK